MTGKAETTDVRERILDSARALFTEKGYEGTSVRDIASDSGTNVAMVNYYFRSKFNLFEKIFEESFDELVGQVFSVLRSDAPFPEIIETWVDTYFKVLANYPETPNFILTAAHQNPEGLTQKALKYTPDAVFARLSALIEAEADKGNIKKIPAENLALMILSLCVFPFVVQPIIIEVAGASPGQYAKFLEGHKKYIVDFIMDAIKT